MSEDLAKLQRLLEQATAAEGTSADDLDPEAQSLREAWIGLGRLLEAAQPPVGAAVQLPHQLDPLSPLPSGENQALSPLPLGEGPGVRAMPRRARTHRWLVSAAALMAAALLIGILATWGPRATDRPKSFSPAAPQTAAINAPGATLVQRQREAARTAAEPQWDDSLDEQIAQVDQQVTSAQDNQLFGTDDFALMQYRVEQFRQEVQADSL